MTRNCPAEAATREGDGLERSYRYPNPNERHTMTRKAYAKKFTDEERAAYKEAQRKEATDKLEAAITSLETSDGFRSWLRARALFHTYSLNNTLLIVAQCPHASRIGSAKVWNELGRHIVKGSRSLKVFAPVEWHVACEASAPGAKYNEKRKRWERKVRSFKLVPVFDVSQTEGDALPHLEVADVDGDTHGRLIDPLMNLAESLGYKVSVQDTGDAGGWCDASAKVIAVSDQMGFNGMVRVLVHEIAHALGVGYAQYGRGPAEVIVEAATYIVLAGQGFDLDPTSVPYIAGWGKGKASVTMAEFAATIDEIARKIEAVL